MFSSENLYSVKSTITYLLVILIIINSIILIKVVCYFFLLNFFCFYFFLGSRRALKEQNFRPEIKEPFSIIMVMIGFRESSLSSRCSYPLFIYCHLANIFRVFHSTNSRRSVRRFIKLLLESPLCLSLALNNWLIAENPITLNRFSKIARTFC